MSLHQYCYEPLENPSQQIRLLKLNATRDNGSVITASLSTHKIPFRNASRTARFRSHLDLPGYFALSYVWGAQSALDSTYEIIVDGRQFPITANLHAALHQFRATTTTSLRLWVDAVCINQADENEKSAQIPLMRDIYHLALEVHVWLGDATSKSDRVLQFFRRVSSSSFGDQIDDLAIKLADIDTGARNLGQRKRPLGKLVRTESERVLISGLFNGLYGLLRGVWIGLDVKFNSLQDGLDGEGGIGYNADDDITALMSWSPSKKALKQIASEDLREIAELMEETLFSDTQYFNRIWTLQEICVAQMASVVFQRGTSIFDLDDFARVIYYLQRTLGICTPSLQKITQLILIGLNFNDGRRLTLRDLIFESRGRESHDPRDRIYALHGLMRDAVNPLLQPDYSKSVAEVFANAARHIIASQKSLDILCGHQLHEKLEGLPSWAPDFRSFGLGTGALVPASGRNILYHASLSEVRQAPESLMVPESWESLPVTGTFLDTVSHVSELSLSGSKEEIVGFNSTEKSWAKALMEHHKLTPEEAEAIKTISDLVGSYDDFYRDPDKATFWTRKPEVLQQIRSLTGKMSNQSDTAVNLHFKYFLTLLCGRIEPETRCNKDELEEKIALACIPNAAGIEAFERLCLCLDTGIRYRRLIITTGDEIKLGAAPKETRESDLVCVLIGCSVPVILRKTVAPDKYQFIGECYFHNFMDGEALSMRDEGKLVSRSFQLR